jgi:hypothetical protein
MYSLLYLLFLLDHNLKLPKLIFRYFFVTKSKGWCASSWPTASTTILKSNIGTYLAVLAQHSEQNHYNIQGVSEISALILTGNRTHQNEQLFCLPFWRKKLRNGLKK